MENEKIYGTKTREEVVATWGGGGGGRGGRRGLGWQLKGDEIINT